MGKSVIINKGKIIEYGIKNKGIMPNEESYVIVILKNGSVLFDKAINFRWDFRHKGDITHYLEVISDEKEAKGVMPVDGDTLVCIRLNSGSKFIHRAKEVNWNFTPNSSSNISYYRILKGKNEANVKHYCDICSTESSVQSIRVNKRNYRACVKCRDRWLTKYGFRYISSSKLWRKQLIATDWGFIKRFKRCELCKEIVDANEKFLLYNGEYMCNTCYTEREVKISEEILSMRESDSTLGFRSLRMFPAIYTYIEINREQARISAIRKKDEKAYLDAEDKKAFREKKGVFLKPGKIYPIMEKAYESKITQRTKDKLSSYIKIFDILKTLDIKESENLSEIYDLPHCNSNTIGSSCMRGKGEFYDNLEQNAPVKVLYTVNENYELTSRALLWETNLGKYVDRVYAMSNVLIDAYTRYAKENGYLIRSNHSAGFPGAIDKDGRFVPNLKIEEVNLDIRYDSECEYMPYLDSFNKYNFATKELIAGSTSNYTHTLTETDGTCSTCKYICHGCNLTSDNESSISPNGIDIYCSNACAENDGWIRFSNNWYRKKDMVTTLNGDVVPKRITTRLNADLYGENAFELTIKTIITENGEFILNDDARCINGDIYYKNNVPQAEELIKEAV